MTLLVFLLGLLGTSASAGAWLRDRGDWFASTSVEAGNLQVARDLAALDPYASLYLEYGLARSLTLGLNLGQGATSDPDLRAFARIPVFDRDGQILSLELSVGTVGDDSYTALGLGYGRGFRMLGRDGWFQVDTRVRQATGGDLLGQPQVSKLDLTLGLSHPSGLKTMAQVFTTETGGDLYATFAPGLVLPLGKRTHIETGLLFDVIDGGPPGLKLGLWQSF